MKRIMGHHRVGLISEMQGWFNTGKSVNMIYHINRIKDKNCIITLKDAEKALDRIQHCFRIKAVNKLVKVEEGLYHFTMKTIYDQSTGNIILNGETLKVSL